MKTALLTPTFFKHSGPDRVVENEAKEGVRAGNEITVFTFTGDIKARGYKVVLLGMPGNSTLERVYRLFFFLDIFKILRVSRMLKGYDEVISFLYPMTILGATANKYYKKKFTYYNVGVAYPKVFGSFYERVYMRLFNIFTNFTVKNATNAISISDFLRKELKREVGIESKVKHVKVDSTKYNIRLDKKRIANVKRKHRLKGPVLLYVGRLSPHKGIHLLLRAFKSVKEEVPEAKLLIVGKHTFDSYSKKLQKIASKDVVFAGFVAEEELPYYFGASDLYVTASLWEGFDIPSVQAQMCGKKVVAFDVGSHAEVVKKGTLVKAGDIPGFAKAVIETLKK